MYDCAYRYSSHHVSHMRNVIRVCHQHIMIAKNERFEIVLVTRSFLLMMQVQDLRFCTYVPMHGQMYQFNISHNFLLRHPHVQSETNIQWLPASQVGQSALEKSLFEDLSAATKEKKIAVHAYVFTLM